MGEEVNCMVTDRNQTCGGDHFVVYKFIILYYIAVHLKLIF